MNGDITGLFWPRAGRIVALLTYFLRILERSAPATSAGGECRDIDLAGTDAQPGIAREFWREINALDEKGAGAGSEEHLSGMAFGGLLIQCCRNGALCAGSACRPRRWRRWNAKALMEIGGIYTTCVLSPICTPR